MPSQSYDPKARVIRSAYSLFLYRLILMAGVFPLVILSNSIASRLLIRSNKSIVIAEYVYVYPPIRPLGCTLLAVAVCVDMVALITACCEKFGVFLTHGDTFLRVQAWIFLVLHTIITPLCCLVCGNWLVFDVSSFWGFVFGAAQLGVTLFGRKLTSFAFNNGKYNFVLLEGANISLFFDFLMVFMYVGLTDLFFAVSSMLLVCSLIFAQYCYKSFIFGDYVVDYFYQFATTFFLCSGYFYLLALTIPAFISGFLPITVVCSSALACLFMFVRAFQTRRRLLRVMGLLQYIHAAVSSIMNHLITYEQFPAGTQRDCGIYAQIVKSTGNKYSIDYYRRISRHINANAQYYTSLDGYQGFKTVAVVDNSPDKQSYYSVEQCVNFLQKQRITSDDLISAVLYLLKINNRCKSIVDIQEYTRLFKLQRNLSSELNKPDLDENIEFQLCKQHFNLHVVHLMLLLMLLKPRKHFANALFFVLLNYRHISATDSTHNQSPVCFDLQVSNGMLLSDDVKLIFNKHLNVNKNYQIQLFPKYDMQRMLSGAKAIYDFNREFLHQTEDLALTDEHLQNMKTIEKQVRDICSGRRDIQCIDVFVDLVVLAYEQHLTVFNKYFDADATKPFQINFKSIINLSLVQSCIQHVKFYHFSAHTLYNRVQRLVAEYGICVDSNIEREFHTWLQMPEQLSVKRYYELSQKMYNFQVHFQHFFEHFFTNTVSQENTSEYFCELTTAICFLKSVVALFNRQLELMVQLQDVLNNFVSFNGVAYSQEEIIASFRRYYGHIFGPEKQQHTPFVPTYYSANCGLVTAQYLRAGERLIEACNENIRLFLMYNEYALTNATHQTNVHMFCLLKQQECVKQVQKLLEYLLNVHFLDPENSKTINFIENVKQALNLNSLRKFLDDYEVIVEDKLEANPQELTVALNNVRNQLASRRDAEYQLNVYEKLEHQRSSSPKIGIHLDRLETKLKANERYSYVYELKKHLLQRKGFDGLLSGPVLSGYYNYGNSLGNKRIYPLNNLTYQQNLAISLIFKDVGSYFWKFAFWVTVAFILMLLMFQQFRSSGQQTINLLFSILNVVATNGELQPVLFYQDLIELLNGCLSVALTWQYYHVLVNGLKNLAFERTLEYFSAISEHIKRGILSQIEFFDQFYVRIKIKLFQALEYVLMAAQTQSQIGSNHESSGNLLEKSLVAAYDKYKQETRLLPTSQVVTKNWVVAQTSKFQHFVYNICIKVVDTVIEGIPQIFSFRAGQLVEVPRDQFIEILSNQRFGNSDYLREVLGEISVNDAVKTSYRRYGIEDSDILFDEIQQPTIEDFSFSERYNVTELFSHFGLDLVRQKHKKRLISKYPLQQIAADPTQQQQYYEILVQDWSSESQMLAAICALLAILACTAVLAHHMFIHRIKARMQAALDREHDDHGCSHTAECGKKRKIAVWSAAIFALLLLVIAQAFYNKIVVIDKKKQMQLVENVAYDADRLFKQHVDQLHNSIMYQLQGSVQHLRNHELVNAYLEEYLTSRCPREFSGQFCVAIEKKLHEQFKTETNNMAAHLALLNPQTYMPKTHAYMQTVKARLGCTDGEIVKMPFYYRHSPDGMFIDTRESGNCQILPSLASLHCSKFYIPQMQDLRQEVERRVSKITEAEFLELYDNAELLFNRDAIIASIEQLHETKDIIESYFCEAEQEFTIFMYQNKNNHFISEALLVAFLVVELLFVFKAIHNKGGKRRATICVVLICSLISMQIGEYFYLNNVQSSTKVNFSEPSSFQYLNRLEQLFNMTADNQRFGQALHFAQSSLLFNNITVQYGNEPVRRYQQYSFEALAQTTYPLFSDTAELPSLQSEIQCMVTGAYQNTDEFSKYFLILGSEFEELSAKLQEPYRTVDFEYENVQYCFMGIQLALALAILVINAVGVAQMFSYSRNLAEQRVNSHARLIVNIRQLQNGYAPFDTCMDHNIKKTAEFDRVRDERTLIYVRYMLECCPQLLATSTPDYVEVNVHAMDGSIARLPALQTIIVNDQLCQRCRIANAVVSSSKLSASPIVQRYFLRGFHGFFTVLYVLIAGLCVMVAVVYASLRRGERIASSAYVLIHQLERLENAFNKLYAQKLFQTTSTRLLTSRVLNEQIGHFNNLVGELSTIKLIMNDLKLDIAQFYALERMVSPTLAYQEYDGFNVMNFGGDDFDKVMQLFGQLRIAIVASLRSKGYSPERMSSALGFNMLNIATIAIAIAILFLAFRAAQFSFQNSIFRYNMFSGIRASRGLRMTLSDARNCH